MKKAIHPLLFTAILLVVFTSGVLVGRLSNHNEVAITIKSAQHSASYDGADNVDQRLNINTASFDELQEIPGVGPALAQQIVDYREEYGDYESSEDLLNVSGIGSGKLKALLEYITVGD